MIRVKAWVFTPQILICYVLLAVILAFEVNNKPAELPVPAAKEITPVSNPNVLPVDNPFGGIESPVDWKLTKDFQIQIEKYGKYGRCAIVWDRDRVVRVLPLDNQCNLTFLINHDQE